MQVVLLIQIILLLKATSAHTGKHFSNKGFFCKSPSLHLKLFFPCCRSFKGKTYPWGRETSTFKETYCQLETLETDEALPTDEGHYTCTVTASNRTSVSRNISLCVNMNEDSFGAPVKSNITGDSIVLPGEEITFTCSAYVGRPICLSQDKHSITWEKLLHNGSWVSAQLLHHVHTFCSENESGKIWSNLKISRVQAAHYGLYRCTIVNHHGHLSLNVTLFRGVTGTMLEAGQYRASLAVLAAVVVFLVVSSCVWRRTKMIMALYCRSKTNTPPDGCQYDVFVVHGDSACGWVWTVLLPTLEDVYGYTCFLPQRDLCGGELVIEVMAAAVAQCRRVVVVVTPCLLANPWAAWAMYHAMQAALNTQTRVLALVLKDLKTEDVPDTSGILGILKLVQKINVPYCCDWQGDDPSEDVATHQPLHTTQQMTHTTKISRSIKRCESKLTFPRDISPTIRSRSKSPNKQRLSNMITGNNAASKKDSDDDMKIKVGGPVIYTEESYGLQDPGSPCSLTPFILPSSGESHAAPSNSSLFESLRECLKVLCTGDHKRVFWHTVRCHLGPPAQQRRLNDHTEAEKL
nr:interleukin-1 receptor accessory protein-like 1 [Cherax quadricarinatus]